MIFFNLSLSSTCYSLTAHEWLIITRFQHTIWVCPNTTVILIFLINVAKCNLGKVNLEAMLVSSFPSYSWGGPMPLAGAPRDLYTQLLACSSLQSVVAITCCLRASLCFGFSNPSLPLGGGLGKYWVGKYSTELFSVTVPGGGRSQGCHGYLLHMLEHCTAPPTL